MTEAIKEFWFLLAAGVYAVAWLIRLESRGITAQPGSPAAIDWPTRPE